MECGPMPTSPAANFFSHGPGLRESERRLPAPGEISQSRLEFGTVQIDPFLISTDRLHLVANEHVPLPWEVRPVLNGHFLVRQGAKLPRRLFSPQGIEHRL